MMRTMWTKEEDEVLRQMIDTGRAVTEMTKVLKSRSVNAIEGRCKHLGLKFSRSPRPIIDREALKAMLKVKTI